MSSKNPALSGWRLLTGALCVLALGALTQPALADGSSTGTVSVEFAAPPVRSVNVSPSAFSFSDCDDAYGPTTVLVVPEGVCSSPVDQLVVTNGPVDSTIVVSATDFIPNDGGTPWELRSNFFSGTGTDQAFLSLTSQTIQEPITNTDAPDETFSDGGLANAGQSVSQSATVFAPDASTDQDADSFSTTITWTANP